MCVVVHTHTHTDTHHTHTYMYSVQDLSFINQFVFMPYFIFIDAEQKKGNFAGRGGGILPHNYINSRYSYE